MRFIALPLLLGVLASLLGFVTPARAAHPQILVTPADRDAVKAKLESAPWAKTAYAKLKDNVDHYVALTQTDPKFVSSRLMMNWDTHYITPLVEKSRSVGGEGHAPIPTPRFAGGRDWASDYGRPARLEDWKPYNDQNSKVYLRNNKTGQEGWVDPGLTGHTFEAANQQIMGYAADAAFVYWLTGDEKYARFASEILWTYMDGFSYTQPPKAVTPDPSMMRVIGPTTFEVIHENIVISIALAYDFLYPYLVQQGKDVMLIQNGLKRWAQRVTDGGGREGNWNLNQAMMIAYAGLALEDDSAYADHKGRPYYVNVVLNADLPAQKGLTLVIKEGFDPTTGLWPEAAGYGFGSAGQVIELASLMQSDPAGQAVLGAPLLSQGLINQGELLYPNGLSNGVGDTTNGRLNAGALENLIAYARKRGDAKLETQLASYLDREIASGNYDRSKRSDIYALTRFVAELPPAAAAPAASRSFFFPGLNILMQRNLAQDGDPRYSLAAALYGTNGGHVHQNGLAIELFGAGSILGADPGRGGSYWLPEHRNYYVEPVAHNTVVVNGVSTYDEYKDPKRAMTLESVEPASQSAALSPDIGYARASFSYAKPSAQQDRTLALIRTGPKSGFYWDVFRSRAANTAGEFNDYFYHDMGTLSAVSPPLTPSITLAQPGLLKGYSYFKNERSAASGDVKATWTFDVPGQPSMTLWMSGDVKRTVFAVDAPKNNAIRDSIPANVRDKPMPTLVVRQEGEAWDRPFVGIYEPFLNGENTIKSARAAHITGDAPSLAATVVEGNDYRVHLFQDVAPTAPRTAEGVTFQGEFGAVIERGGTTKELYLGDGKSLSAGGCVLQSADNIPVKACLRRDGNGWNYSADGAVKITLPGEKAKRLPAARNAPIGEIKPPKG